MSKSTWSWGPRALARLATLTLLAGVLSVGSCSSAQESGAIPTAAPGAAAQPLVPVEAASFPLSGEWRFATDPRGIGVEEGWTDPGFDDSSWAVVQVPHTWNVMPEYVDYEGLAWYRRHFALPAAAEEGRLSLRFEAVFYAARVWLNGVLLGEHEGGYTPFEYDVSGIARPGEENVVVVRVDNVRASDRIPAALGPRWSFDWWNYGGIVRDVALQLSSRVYVAAQRIVAVPHIVAWDEADTATITATLTVDNRSGDAFEGTLSADVLDDSTGSSVLAALLASPVSVPPGESVDVQLVTTIASPRLWHFDHPSLYRWSTSLRADDGAVLHAVEDTFGVRRVELREAQLVLNGEPVRLVGLTRHADSPEFGLAETVTVMAADYDDLRRLNMVFSRPVHYPQSRFILDYCDRNGILLIPEVPAWQLSAQQMSDPEMLALAQRQLAEMIAADFNHPSVWAWSVGNEFDSKSPAGHAYVRAMIDLAHELDPTRPVGFASNLLDAAPGRDATDLADLVLMNQYFGTWVGPKGNLGPALDLIHATWPDRVVVISEFGFEPHWNALWGPPTASLDPAQYYLIPDDVPSDAEEADAQRRQLILEQMETFRSRPYVVGAIFWTYQDYRTRTGFVMGVVDAERNRRGSWAVLREQYSPALFDDVSLVSAGDATWRATVRLHARGPVEQELPAYTLRGYTLHWAVTSAQQDETYSEGELSLPVLAPGEAWSGEVEWTAPTVEVVLVLSIVRPTGFPVLEHAYDGQGQELPGDA
jgi:hypothetical protein